jgi:sec-independent protein translocase protein TatC
VGLPSNRIPVSDEAERSDAGDGADRMPAMTLGEHLDDLRRRLVLSATGLALSMTLCLIFGKEIMVWIEKPFVAALTEMHKDPSLAVTTVTGVFTTYLRISFYAGLVLASPWIFYQLWSFVAAGLYRRERRYVWLALPFSLSLFLLGAVFATYLSIPAIKFFISFGDDMGIKPIIMLDDYVSFMTNLLLAFGAVFQVPLVVLVLARVGLVDLRMLHHYRRHVVVAMAAIAAVLAPVDPGSMMAMLLPMWLLYELGIFLAWLLVFRKNRTVSDE